MQYLLITTLALATAASALAVPLDYKIGSNSSVHAYDSNPSNNGLSIQTQLDAGLSSVFFNLDDAQAAIFPLFLIRTPEGSVEADDLTSQVITATLDFDIPDELATVTGHTVGENLYKVIGRFSISLYDTAHLTWDGPTVVNAGDRSFQVELDEVEFNRGSGLDFDLGSNGTLVKAKVTQISSNVPDGGATFVTMATALAGLGLAGRGFRR